MYSVSWQDAADLYVAVSVTYVDSGKKEIDKYVATVIMPQLNALVSEVESDVTAIATDKAIVVADKAIVEYDTAQVAADKQTVKNYRDEVIGSLQNYYTKSEIDTALAGYQTKANLVTALSSDSTDVQYPSAKCVYDLVGDVETLINAL